MVISRAGHMLGLEVLRVQFGGHSSFQFISESLTTNTKLFVDDTSFFQLFVILEHLQYLLIIAYRKFLDNFTNGR